MTAWNDGPRRLKNGVIFKDTSAYFILLVAANDPIDGGPDGWMMVRKGLVRDTKSQISVRLSLKRHSDGKTHFRDRQGVNQCGGNE